MFKKLPIAGFVVLGVGFTVLSILAGFATREFMNPKRRALQDYHGDWLNEPAKQGVTIDKVTLLAGQVPCLVVNPDATVKAAKRGALLRQQMKVKGHALDAFGQVNGQVVILHGRSGRKEDMLPIAERFCAIGFRCLLPDMPGHGDNKIDTIGFGAGEGEDVLIQTLFDQAVDQNLMSKDLPSSLIGISMGGAYAVKTAQKSSQWKNIIIICSFDELDGVIDSQCRQRFGIISGVFGKMAKSKAESLSGLKIETIQPKVWAADIKIPALVIHGTDDKVIAMDRGRMLYQAFGGEKKQWIEVPGAGHSNILITPMEVFATMGEWLVGAK